MIIWLVRGKCVTSQSANVPLMIISVSAPATFVSLCLLQPLDFETKSSFSLRIEATNRNIDTNFLNLGPFSDTTSVKVTVQDVDEPPVFSALLTSMMVSEDARVGTSIGKVYAHDPDTSNNAIRYRSASYRWRCSRQAPRGPLGQMAGGLWSGQEKGRGVPA